jgi:hypothetical protein
MINPALFLRVSSVEFDSIRLSRPNPAATGSSPSRQPALDHFQSSTRSTGRLARARGQVR